MIDFVNFMWLHFDALPKYSDYVNRKLLLPRLQKKKPVDFDDELKIGDVRYDNLTKITIKGQLF